MKIVVILVMMMTMIMIGTDDFEDVASDENDSGDGEIVMTVRTSIIIVMVVMTKKATITTSIKVMMTSL